MQRIRSPERKTSLGIKAEGEYSFAMSANNGESTMVLGTRI